VIAVMRITENRWMVVGALVLLCGATQTAGAQTAVYKTVDDVGNVAFTDRPPLDKPAEKLNGLSLSVTDTAGIDAEQEQAAEDEQYQQTAQNIRENQTTEDEAFQTAVADQQNAACRAANARMSKYEKARRLYRERGDGEREYLNDAELDSERADAARAVDELCG
jgi:hypothetical protein